VVVLQLFQADLSQANWFDVNAWKAVSFVQPIDQQTVDILLFIGR
jgi:hypothetical protein